MCEEFNGLVERLYQGGRLLQDSGEQVRERSRAALGAAGKQVTRRECPTCQTFDVRQQLEERRLSTLAVVGEHDSLTPPQYHEYLAEKPPDCEVAVVADAHLMIVERPVASDATLETVTDR